MIVRDKPSVLNLLLTVRGSVLPHIAVELALFTAISVVVVWIDQFDLPLPHVNATPFATFGVALSLFLGFRNNAAYDRWWEARKLWGGLLADLRSLAREAEMFIPDDALRARVLRLSLAFIHLHRLQLRKSAPDADALAALRAADALDLTSTRHPPCAALDRIGADLAQAYRTGQIDGFGARALTQRFASLELGKAGAERIAVTPLPYVYSLLIYRTSYLFCLLFPLALVEPAGWLTPLFVMIVAYVFFGLAEVTEEMAHPFGPTQNALPLDAICRACEISLAPHLRQEAPPPLKPVNFVLT